MTPESLKRDLESLARFMRCNHFFCLGGEPLLHPELPELLIVARASGISEKCGIVTNGDYLCSVSEDVFKALQILRLSAYPGLKAENLQKAFEMKARYGFELGVAYPATFFLQFGAPVAGALKQHRFDLCPWKKECYVVHSGRLYLCPQSVFFPPKFMDTTSEEDGLDLHDDLTEEKLSEFLHSTRPRKACEICSAYTHQALWKESHSFDEWMKDSQI